MQQFGIREYAEAGAAIEEFTTHWRHGASGLLRQLIDAETIELLGGPLSHPFQPLLNPRLREFALREGLADAQQRFAHTPVGIWAPECAYAPGMETGYAAAGVGHFMVDGPSLHGDTTLGRPVGDSDVVAFGRDLQVSYRVWSPKSGYPGHAAYRDFHTYDHTTGLKPARVTGRNVPSEEKAPYDPQRADRAIDEHVADFVEVVRRRLVSESRADRPPGARGGRVRHRAVRALVVRGPGVAGPGAARTARGRCAGGHPRGCQGRRIRRCPGRIAAQLMGFGQELAGVERREGGRSGAAQQRGGRRRTEHRGQGAHPARRGRCTDPARPRRPIRSCERRC